MLAAVCQVMQKQVRDFDVQFSFDWTYGIELSRLKEDLEALEKLGATHVEIEPYTEYDCSYVSIKAICRREETDEEMQRRVKEEQARQDEYKRRDLEQLEHLKAKYGL